MSILHALAKMEHESSVVNLGVVRLKVTASDSDAAVLLIKFLDDFADGKHTNGEAEALLLENWMKAVLAEGNTSLATPFDGPRAQAIWNALWWFRFLVALAPDESPQESLP